MSKPKFIWVKEIEEIGQHWSRAWVSADPDADSIDPTDVKLTLGDQNEDAIENQKLIQSMSLRIKELEEFCFAARMKKHELAKENGQLKKTIAHLEKVCKEMTEAMSDPGNRQMVFGMENNHEST